MSELLKDGDAKNNIVGGIPVDRLRSICERIERLEEERSAINEDIRSVFAESKSAGFDQKALKQVLKLRKMDASDRDNMECIVDVYRKALDI